MPLNQNVRDFCGSAPLHFDSDQQGGSLCKGTAGYIAIPGTVARVMAPKIHNSEVLLGRDGGVLGIAESDGVGRRPLASSRSCGEDDPAVQAVLRAPGAIVGSIRWTVWNPPGVKVMP